MFLENYMYAQPSQSQPALQTTASSNLDAPPRSRASNPLWAGISAAMIADAEEIQLSGVEQTAPVWSGSGLHVCANLDHRDAKPVAQSIPASPPTVPENSDGAGFRGMPAGIPLLVEEIELQPIHQDVFSSSAHNETSWASVHDLELPVYPHHLVPPEIETYVEALPVVKVELPEAMPEQIGAIFLEELEPSEDHLRLFAGYIDNPPVFTKNHANEAPAKAIPDWALNANVFEEIELLAVETSTWACAT